ncbi:hypothetical protein [Streptomyces sp. NBC_00401]
MGAALSGTVCVGAALSGTYEGTTASSTRGVCSARRANRPSGACS